jgi:hypothetical protein
MTAATLATVAALSGLQACRDVESEKVAQVNELIQRSLGQDSLRLSLPMPLNSRRFAHEIWVSDYFRCVLRSGTAAFKE